MIVQEHPVYFKNDQFCTDMIELWYPLPKADTEIAERTILPSLLMKSSAAYPEEKTFRMELLKRYIDSIGVSIETIGTQLFYCIHLYLPNQKLLPDLDLSESLTFFLDTIFHPDLVDGAFARFELEKMRLQSSIQKSYKEKGFYAQKRVMEELDPTGFLCQKLSFHPELLEELSSSKVLEFYQKTIVEQVPFVFLFGSEAVKSLIPKLEQQFDFKKIPPKITFDCNQFLRPATCRTIEELKPYQESVLWMVYKVEQMKEEDRLKLMVLNRILSSSASPILMNELRNEQKLVYGIGSSSYSHFGFLAICCEVAGSATKKACDHIQTLMKNLSLSQLEEGLKAVQEQNQISLLRKLDQKYAIFNDLVDTYFKVELSLEEETRQMEAMTAQEIKELLSRLQLDLVYCLKGEEHEAISS